MATASYFSRLRMEFVERTPTRFQGELKRIAAGKNPQAQFPFTEIKIIRGTHPHPPHTDLQEVRSSIAIQFVGVPGGSIVAHLFHDGTLKTSTQMHQENNQRRAEEERLDAEESQFPQLQQTPLRKQAYDKKMRKIRGARDNDTWSIIRKQLEKQSAEEEYNRVLQEQAQARAFAAGQV